VDNMIAQNLGEKVCVSASNTWTDRRGVQMHSLFITFVNREKLMLELII